MSRSDFWRGWPLTVITSMLAAAACALDWPQGRLTIQVLDDGDSENHDALAAAVCHALRGRVRASLLRSASRG